MRTFGHLILFLGLVAAGGSTGLAQDALDKKVDIRENAFLPDYIQIRVGDRLMWANMTQEEQRIVSADDVFETDKNLKQVEKPLFDSGTIPVDRYFVWTFDRPGSFDYYNARHPMIRGTVVVTLPLPRESE